VLYLQSVRGRPKGHQPGLEKAWAEIARIRQLGSKLLVERT
jgi:hypothetical protein